MKSKKPLTANTTAYNLLKSRLFEIQKPPTKTATVKETDVAERVDGRTFRFEQNSFGLTHFKLSTFNLEDAKLVLGLNISRSEEYGEREIPLGMNGQYIISNNTRFETPMAAKAKWLSDYEIEVDYNDFSSNHKYIIRIRFDNGTNAFWEMYDEAGFGESLNLKAKAIDE